MSRAKVLTMGGILVLVSLAIGFFIHDYLPDREGVTSLQKELETLQRKVDEVGKQITNQQQQMEKLSERIKALGEGSGDQNQGEPQRIAVSTDDDPVLGDPQAPVTVVEFSDFQCPYCKRFFDQTMPEIKEKYIDTGKVKLVYRDFPLSSIHSNAELAARASECAHDQGKFWAMHDRIYSGQLEWSKSSEPKLDFEKYAQDIELNMEKFSECLDSDRYSEEIQKDLKDGVQYGVKGTPTFFINGLMLRGAQPFSAFKEVIEAELAKQK